MIPCATCQSASCVDCDFNDDFLGGFDLPEVDDEPVEDEFEFME